MVPDLGERRGRTSLACLVATAALAGTGCGGTAGDTGTNVGGAASGNELTALAALGKKIFRDESLSGSGRMSCATCHDPAHAFAQPTSDPVPLGMSISPACA